MGTSLGNLSPGSTYPGLLKFGDNDILSSDVKTISDGEGNDTIIGLSSSYLSVGGSGGWNYDNSTARSAIGGGLSEPGFGVKLRVIGQGDASVAIYRNQASSFSGKLEFMKSRGTYSSPLISVPGDRLGTISFFSHNGTTYTESATIYAVAGATGGTSLPGTIRFSSRSTGGGNIEIVSILPTGVSIINY
jgi:hypothetical protein